MKKTILLFFISLTTFSQSKYERDFNNFWVRLNLQFAYFDSKQTNWNKVKEIYQPQVKKAKSDIEFLEIIERVILELYEPHVGLNRNRSSSFRLIPNDTDAWIKLVKGKYFIEDLRDGYSIQNSGLKEGSQLISFNGKKIEDLVFENLPKSFINHNKEVKEYLVNMIFAGKHNEPRNLEVLKNGIVEKYSLEKAKKLTQESELITVKVIKNNVGYIKINNSLFDNRVIKMFPKAVDSLENTKAIIIDLRDTHRGGNAEVAKSIMGKFITEEMPFQVHERVGLEREFGIKRKYVEILFPLDNPYRKPVYILVGRWTGSVGEAIAQGFSNIETAKVIGTEMAKLKGAVTCFTLQETGIGICFPFEKLYNINGTPREDFIPEIITNTSRETYKKVLKIINE